jgi:hypothetical protein
MDKTKLLVLAELITTRLNAGKCYVIAFRFQDLDLIISKKNSLFCSSAPRVEFPL